jgi:hypothetical protein
VGSPIFAAAATTFLAVLPLLGRGLHSSTSRLNVNAFCGLWGACQGYLGGV